MDLDIYDFSEENMLEEMKVLIKQGEDLNIKNEFGWTPLHLAISSKHEEMALMLLEHGADPSVQDNNGFNALHYVAGNNMYTVAEIILKKKPEVIHVENKNTAQPLYIAVNKAKRPFDMIKLFLKNGADKDYGDIGSTAFDRAKSYNIDEVVDLFDGY